jgi:CP family cyanate transporter-like MFS transporter
VDPDRTERGEVAPGPSRLALLGGLGIVGLIGADLRAGVLAIPPLLGRIESALHPGTVAAGLLTTGPTLMLGLAGAASAPLVRRLGPSGALAVLLGLIALASAVRAAASSTVELLVITFCFGFLLAAAQPIASALSSTIARVGPARAGAALATGMVVGEALAASLSAPALSGFLGGWRPALAFWSVPVAVAAVGLGIRSARHRPEADAEAPRPGSVPASPGERARVIAGAIRQAARSRFTWRDGFVQAGASTVYFGTSAYLPLVLEARHLASLVPACLSALSVAQIPTTVALVVLGYSPHHRARLLSSTGAATAAGLVMILMGRSGALVIGGAALVGVTSAVAFALCLALPQDAPDAVSATRRASAMFTVGYLCAFFLPLLSGATAELTHAPDSALWSAFVAVGLLEIAAFWLAQDSSSPRATGRAESALHSDHEPG